MVPMVVMMFDDVGDVVLVFSQSLAARRLLVSRRSKLRRASLFSRISVTRIRSRSLSPPLSRLLTLSHTLALRGRASRGPTPDPPLSGGGPARPPEPPDLRNPRNVEHIVATVSASRIVNICCNS